MNTKHIDALDVASRQHGVITRAQALAAGLSEGAINACLANGLFVALNSEVFRVRGAPQTEAMAITAAVLSAAGRVSHATGGRLLRFETSLPVSPIHVTVDGDHQRPRVIRLEVDNGKRAFFRVQVHRYTDFGEPTTTVDGVACVDAARALIDIASHLTAENLENAFERARRLGLLSTESLARRFALIGGRGRPGTLKIRELLANAAPNALDSKLEVKAWRMLSTSRLKNPARQVRVDRPSGRGHRLDFAWPERLVAFETEGFEWHGSRARWKQDRIRTAALERLGSRIVVGTWDDVVDSPAETLDRIAMALDECRSLRRAS